MTDSSSSADALVGIAMGSDSDWPIASMAAEVLDEFDIPWESKVVSAHRTPHELLRYGGEAADRGLRVLIGAAGGAAHLPGMLASVTPLPVIGLPVPLSTLDGMDSLLSIVQMPKGIPVATVAIGNGRNAGILAARILGSSDPVLRARLVEFQDALAAESRAKNDNVQQLPPTS